MAQLIFLSKRGQPGLLTGVAFLTTRVEQLDEDDLKKLKRVVNYLRNTKERVLPLESNDSANI